MTQTEQNNYDRTVESTKLTKNFTSHENHTDDRGHVQPLPGNFPFTLAVLLRMTVVMTMLNADHAIFLGLLLAGCAG